MRQPKPDTHQACRSLLQKAVRRGYTTSARNVISHLDQIGDTAWLKQRTGVIVFEECWPLGGDLSYPLDLSAMVSQLENVARTVKAKDAAGLGSLAYAYSEGDFSTLSGENSPDEAIKVIAKAIKEPTEFWSWAQTECKDENQIRLVDAARQSHRKGGWPWDKAFMLAAAFLAVSNGIPEMRTVVNPPSTEFPYWVALDKHTPQGKKALRKAADKLGLPSGKVMWVSFYCESATTNQSLESDWWVLETRWRLRKVGLDIENSYSLWEKARPIVIEYLKDDVDWLRKHIETAGEPAVQLSLL